MKSRSELAQGFREIALRIERESTVGGLNIRVSVAGHLQDLRLLQNLPDGSSTVTEMHYDRMKEAFLEAIAMMGNNLAKPMDLLVAFEKAVELQQQYCECVCSDATDKRKAG